MRLEAAFFESVRVLVMRILYNPSSKKFSFKEINDRINELLKQSVKSDGVINLFSDIGEKVNLFDPTFFENISKMKEKNLAVEMLKKLIDEQVKVYKRTNLVKSEAFSELIQQTLNRYLNGMLPKQHQREFLKLLSILLHRLNRHLNRLPLRIPIHPGRNQRKSHSFKPLFTGKLQPGELQPRNNIKTPSLQPLP